MANEIFISRSIKVIGNVVEYIYSAKTNRYELGINRYYCNEFDTYDHDFICFLSSECVKRVTKEKTPEKKLDIIKTFYPDVNYISF